MLESPSFSYGEYVKETERIAIMSNTIGVMHTMNIVKWEQNGYIPKYMVVIDTAKLKKLGYSYNPAIAWWTKHVPYAEVFDEDESFDQSDIVIVVTSQGNLNVRYWWELYSATGEANYGGFMEIDILDEIMALQEAGLLIKRPKGV